MKDDAEETPKNNSRRYNFPKEAALLDGKEIERVNQFVYLGSCFNEYDDDVDDINRRIQKANGSTARIRKMLLNRNTPRRLKVKMIMTFVYPTVSYGCETWALDKDTKSHLDTWWMKLMRRIRGVTKEDRLRSRVILKDLKASKLSEMIEERQLRYAGHVWRYPDTRWAKFMLQAEQTGQKAGKQRQYRKLLSKLMEEKKLTKDMMADTKTWGTKLREIYPRGENDEGKQQPDPHREGNQSN